MNITRQRIRNIILETLKEQSVRARPIYQIAAEIKKSWKNVSPEAEPYLRAMHSMSSVADTYGADDGREIILYFLSNTNGWRGPDAKRLKDELRAAMNVA